MNNEITNIYLTGVGGQGIGLLSEVLLRALDHAGKNAIGVDTHGLAQRGGVVASQIRFGESVTSPIVSKHRADLVIALERHEAARGANEYLKKDGTLVYYNTSWQPLDVRLEKAKEITTQQLEEYCSKNSYKLIKVERDDLTDARMQNVALLSEICRRELVKGVEETHYEQAMKDLMSEKVFEANLKIFRNN